MSVAFDILRIPGVGVALTLEERTLYGLGPVGVDLRDAVAIVQALDDGPGGTLVALGNQFFYAFQRSATTPAALVVTLRGQADTVASTAENANTYRELIGRRFRV